MILFPDFNPDGRLSIFSALDKIGICVLQHFLRNGNSNLILDLRVVWPWLAGRNIYILQAGPIPLKKFVTLTQTR